MNSDMSNFKNCVKIACKHAWSIKEWYILLCVV